MTYFDRRKFDGSALGVGYGSADAFWAMMDSLVDGINEEAGTDHSPVQTETALAALTDYQDKMVILVEDEEGGYRFNAESAAAPVAHSIVVPDNITAPAPGRWIKYTVLITAHNDLTGLQGGAATEYYHLTSADYTARVIMAVVDQALAADEIIISKAAGNGLDASGRLLANVPSMDVAGGANEILYTAAANKAIAKSGLLVTDTPQMPVADQAAVADEVIVSKAVGKGLDASGRLLANVPSMDAAGGANEIVYTAVADKALAKSGLLVTDTPQMPVADQAAVADEIIVSKAIGKGLDASGRLLANVPSMDAAGGVGEILYTAAADKAVAKSGLLVTDTPQMPAVDQAAVADEIIVSKAVGKGLDASGVLLSTVARRVAVPAVANLCGMDADGDPTDSGIVVTNAVTQAVAASAANYLPESAGASKVLAASPLPLVWKQLGLAITKVGVPFCIEVDLNGPAQVIGVFNANAPFAFQVLRFEALCEAAVALGTAKLNNAFAGGGVDITDAVPMAVLDTLSQALKIVQGVKNVALNGSLSVVKNAGADSGRGYVYAVRTA